MSIIERLAPYRDDISLIPEDAPFTPEQRAWLSGFMMALLQPAPGAAAAPAAPAQVALAVLYASQTGTAEGLARKFARFAKTRGIDAKPRDIGSLAIDELAGLGQAVVIAATHGDGEPPDTARAISSALTEATGTPLAGLRFAVLALGDSNYARFCAYGAFLDERLAALGATRVSDRVDVDGDPSDPFTAWRDHVTGLFAAAPGDGAAPAAAIEPDDEPEDAEAEAPGTRGNPIAARIIDNHVLNALGADRLPDDKEVRHIAFSLADSGIAYEPGDALGVVPENPPEMVAAILSATGLDGAVPVTLDGATTLQDALTRLLSLGRLTQAMLIKFAKRAGDAELDALLAPDKADALKDFLDGRDLIDLLLRYPGVIRSAEDLIMLVPRLAPRLYSISSSPKAHPGEVHLTVATVRYRSHGRDRVGIASTFLADRAATKPVGIYIQRNIRFRLPKDDDVPVIMVGPGTGIAPFRAFLQERRMTGARGRNWLFFGDRHAASDFLYRDELERFRADGVLTRLDTAFSRDQAAKVYVQHRMIEQGAGLWHWLQDGAHFYVCGDASRMAKDVDRALKEVIARHGRMGPAAAQLEVDQMIASGRYVRDVY